MSPWFHPNFLFETASMNLVQSSQILSVCFWRNFSIVIQTSSCPASSQKTISIHWWSQKLSSNFKPQLHFKYSQKKLLPPIFNITCLLTLCLLLFNMLTGSFILQKLLFLKFTMTSSLWWIVVRSLHSYFSTYRLSLILSIFPSSLVFKIGSVLMVFLLIGSHLISHLALRQSQSMIPCLHSLLFLWCTPRFRTWPTFFYFLYNSSWLGDLKQFLQISSVNSCFDERSLHFIWQYNSVL